MAVDPICGMTVDEQKALHVEYEGKTWYFCSSHCRDEFLRQKGLLEKAMKKRQIPVMCPTCGGLLKLDTVFFGEALPQKALGAAVEAARNCELMLAAGSYLVVYPVATLPTIATQSGAKFIIINQEPTPLDQMADLVFIAEAGETLTQIVKAIKSL